MTDSSSSARGLPSDIKLFRKNGTGLCNLRSLTNCGKSVTGSPFILPAEAREFAKLRAIACLQSFSDDKSIAMSYAGDKGYLLRLTVPLMESWRFMESRSLMVDGHALYTDVYFIPSQLITRNVSSGDWRLTVKHLGR